MTLTVAGRGPVMFECNQGDTGGLDWTGQQLSSSLPCEALTLTSLPPLLRDNGSTMQSGLSQWSVWRPVISDIIRPIDYQYVLGQVWSGVSVSTLLWPLTVLQYLLSSVSVLVSVSLSGARLYWPIIRHGEGLHSPGTTGELHSGWTFRWRRTASGTFLSSLSLSLSLTHFISCFSVFTSDI